METIRLSTKGQVVLPKQVREAHQWDAGQELTVIDLPDCVMLKNAATATVSWNEVAGRLAKYRKDRAATDEEMHEAVLKEAAASYKRSREE